MANAANGEAPWFLDGFENGSLPKENWTHQAHLTVALWYLRLHGRDRATELLRTNIPRYNLAVGGDPNGYHETITLAWIAVIHDYLARHDLGQTFGELRDGLLAQCGDKHYLDRFYSRERLMSDAARRSFHPPDLAPLP